MEDDEYATDKMGRIILEDGSQNGAFPESGTPALAPKLEPGDNEVRSPASSNDGLKPRSDSVETPNSQKTPKLSRKTSHKHERVSREPVLYDDLPNVTEESCKNFRVIPDCLYGSKHLGSTDNDSFDCDCNQEWRE